MKQYDTHQTLEVTLFSLDTYHGGVKLHFQIYGKSYATFLFKEYSALSIVVDAFLNMLTDVLWERNGFSYHGLEVCYKRKVIRIGCKTRLVVINKINDIDSEELFLEIANRSAMGNVFTVIDGTTNE